MFNLNFVRVHILSLVYHELQFVTKSLKDLSKDESLRNHDSIVFFLMAHGQQGIDLSIQ